MRIELSSCYNCEGCVTEFKCPRNAIKSNELKSGFEIDASKCINCGLCKTEFKCPEVHLQCKRYRKSRVSQKLKSK